MPVAVPDFVDASDLEAYRSGDADTIIVQAQGAIRRYCGWHIAPSLTETITLDGSGSRHLWLPSLFVTAVASVTDCGTAVDSADYDWSATGYIQNRYSCWSSRARQVVVTFTHGYDDVPPELIAVASAVASRRLASPAGIRRETTGPFSIEYGDSGGGGAFMRDELAVLDRFKLPPRP